MTANPDGKVHRSDNFGKVPDELMHDLSLTDGAIRLYAHMHWYYTRHFKTNEQDQKTMAEAMGVSEAAIAKRIKELEAADWIVVVNRKFDKASGNYQTPFYHVFEVQEACREFRQVYKPATLEEVRAKSAVPERKLRKGIGGNPKLKDEAHRPNSSSDGSQSNSSSDGRPNLSSDGRPNSSSDYKEVKEQEQKQEVVVNAPERPTIFSIYESQIGLLTGPIGEELADLEKEFGAVAIEEAIDIALAKPDAANKWKYALGVLKRKRNATSATPQIVPKSDKRLPGQLTPEEEAALKAGNDRILAYVQAAEEEEKGKAG